MYLYLIVGALVQMVILQDVDGGNLEYVGVVVLSSNWCQRVLVNDLVEKVYVYLILAALVQTYVFLNGVGGHLGWSHYVLALSSL